MTTTPTAPTVSDAGIQTAFLGQLPRIRNHAQYALRHIACRDTREELIAEVLALAWKHFASLARRGKKPEEFTCTLALRCTQAVRGGRRLAGCDRARDALSPIAKGRHGVSVVRFGDRPSVPGHDPSGSPDECVFAEALVVDPRARVPEQAALRIDFPEWRGRFKTRDRSVLDALATGDLPGEVAARFGISPARVSQLREAFRMSWHAFHRGEL